MSLTRLILFIACFSIMTVTGCRESDAATAVPDQLASVNPTATAVAEPSATPIPPSPTPVPPTAVPTPVIPDIAIAPQTLTDEGQLNIASVLSPQAGWVVLYTVVDGELGQILGHTAVEPGPNSDISLTIDPLLATNNLAVLLHVDEGQAGQFEYPDGPDIPVEFESAHIAETFTPTFDLSLPVITAADQEILEDGLLTIDNVLALEDGWLVVHADADGDLGPYLGATRLLSGNNDNLTVQIPWQQGTDQLHAVIYHDYGREERLDLPGDDTPFLANGRPISATFTVVYPPDLFVLDQPIVDGRFEVERVYSRGPGWLVVYFDEGGSPGLIIGSTQLAAGVNEHVLVEVLETAVTNPLHILLHQDSDPTDAFDFPRVDPPLVYQERQLLPFSFNTDPGSYLVTSDQAAQPTDDGTLQIIIPYVVTSNAAWAAIQADVDGQPGEILGQTWVAAGLNRNVMVEIEADAATDWLHAALYSDLGEPNVFEYPDGPDIPMQRDRRLLSAPFELIEAE